MACVPRAKGNKNKTCKLTEVQSYNSSGVAVGVSEITFHPGYDYDTFENDFAIWTLSEPIEAGTHGIAYAKLPKCGHDPEAGDLVTAAGWYVVALPITRRPSLPPHIMNE